MTAARPRALPGPRRSPTQAVEGKARRILVLHGPNLNLLGERDPAQYGTTTLAQIDRELMARGMRAGVVVESFQSNSEGELVTRIQAARKTCAAIVINPAAYTHTSVAIRDALEAAGLPAVEVHLSNIHRRESFRKSSLISEVCVGQISGFGAHSYALGLDAAIHTLTRPAPTTKANP